MPENLRAVQLRVGRNVVDLRRSRGWTQEKLAEEAGKDLKHLGQVERGNVNVTIEILAAIAAALDVSVADLFVARPREAAGARVYLIPQQSLDLADRAWQHVMRVTQRPRRRRRRAKR